MTHQIDLVRPFEESQRSCDPFLRRIILSQERHCLRAELEVEDVLRSLYESQRTHSGNTHRLIPIAPPQRLSKDARFSVRHKPIFCCRLWLGSTVGPVARPAFVGARSREKSPIGRPSSADLPASAGEAFPHAINKKHHTNLPFTSHPSPQSKRFSASVCAQEDRAVTRFAHDTLAAELFSAAQRRGDPLFPPAHGSHCLAGRSRPCRDSNLYVAIGNSSPSWVVSCASENAARQKFERPDRTEILPGGWNRRLPEAFFSARPGSSHAASSRRRTRNAGLPVSAIEPVRQKIVDNEKLQM